MLFSSTHNLFAYDSKCISNVIIHCIYTQRQLLEKQKRKFKTKRMREAKMVHPTKIVQTTQKLLFLLCPMLTMWLLLDHQKTWKNFFKQLNNIHEILVIDGIQQNVLLLLYQQHHQPQQRGSTSIINQFLLRRPFNILACLSPELALTSINSSINDHLKQLTIWHYCSN